MQFPRGDTNLKMVQNLESTKEEDECRMVFSIPTMSRPTVFNDGPSSSVHVLGHCVGSHEELKSDNDIRRFTLGNEQVEDLTAIVEKCNVLGFVKPCLTMDKSVFSIPGMFGVPRQEYLSSSVDSIQIDNKAHVRRETGTTAKRTPELVFSTERVIEEEHRESLPRRRSQSRLFETSSSVRESHILAERVRRNEMNELFAQMGSLLPKATPKSDKASIIQETINHIQFLQHQLAIRSNKHGITPKSSETAITARLAENRQTPPTESEGSDHDAPNGNLTVNFHDKNIFITINCAKKANLLPPIILMLEFHSIEVMDALVTITDTGAFHSLHAQSVQILNPAAREILFATLNKFLKLNYKTYIGQQIQKRGN